VVVVFDGAVVVVVDFTVVDVPDFTVVDVADFTVVDVSDFVVVAVVAGADSRAHVIDPTMPSAFRPFFFWKAMTAVAVCAPYLPSLVTLKP
jgi:hypothetical protein